jgi:glycosyltransferase involved in cell wall biosynthesis
MERVFYDRAKAIIGLTEGITNDIVGRGWPAARVQTLPCAVDTTAFVPDERLREQVRRQHGWADKFVVLYFGALGEANNLAVLVRAAQSMRGQSNVVFAVVGDGFRRRWLEAQVRELGLANLRVLPAVPKGDAPAYLNAADACVVTLQDIPVFAGAIPTKLIEYMACGKPVLCGVRGEARRIVEAAGAGMCFEPDDHTALAAGALALRESPEEARASGTRGQAHARAHFDQVGRVKRMAEVLRSAFASA